MSSDTKTIPVLREYVGQEQGQLSLCSGQEYPGLGIVGSDVP